MSFVEFLLGIFLHLLIFPALYALYLFLQWKSVDFDIQCLVDQYIIRKQRWLEGGNHYERFVKEEVLKIRKQKLNSIVGKY